MEQITDIKSIIKEKNSDNIKLDTQDNGLDFNQLLEGMEPTNNSFEKRWDEALTSEEFWGEIEEVIHTHFKNKK